MQQISCLLNVYPMITSLEQQYAGNPLVLRSLELSVLIISFSDQLEKRKKLVVAQHCREAVQLSVQQLWKPKAPKTGMTSFTN